MSETITDNVFDQQPEQAAPPAPPLRGAAAFAATIAGVICAIGIWSVVTWLALNLLGTFDLTLREVAGIGALLTLLVVGIRNTVGSLFNA